MNSKNGLKLEGGRGRGLSFATDRGQVVAKRLGTQSRKYAKA